MKRYRSDITATAQAYLGVPWKHLGRDRQGVDCVGLVIAIWNELKFKPEPNIPPYRAQPDGTMLRYFKPYMTPVSTRRIKAGTVVVYAFQNSPYHAGIVLDPERGSIVHALASERKVVVDMLHHSRSKRTLLCAWDYPEIADG